MYMIKLQSCFDCKGTKHKTDSEEAAAVYRGRLSTVPNAEAYLLAASREMAAVASAGRPDQLPRKSSWAFDQNNENLGSSSLRPLMLTLRAVGFVPNFALMAAVASAGRPDQFLRNSSSALDQRFANRDCLSSGILVRILFLVR
jgi:hypothetical protein